MEDFSKGRLRVVRQLIFEELGRNKVSSSTKACHVVVFIVGVYKVRLSGGNIGQVMGIYSH